MKSRRTSYEIYWEILVYCREPRSFTNIINRCDLNSKIGHQHLTFLVENGYLTTKDSGDRTRYTATAKGLEYTTLFSKIYGALFEKYLDSSCDERCQSWNIALEVLSEPSTSSKNYDPDMIE
jgi:predicted transcriptional regulator